jgi:hypothetical protein
MPERWNEETSLRDLRGACNGLDGRNHNGPWRGQPWTAYNARTCLPGGKRVLFTRRGAGGRFHSLDGSSVNLDSGRPQQQF